MWDQNGRLVRRVADVPLQEEVPTAFDAVPLGPRQAGWRSDAGATLAWDRVDLATGKKVRVFRSEAPYYEEPVALLDPAGSAS